ncbi:hypothetical protein O1611_g6476 [Lasiodiplodia mahajangana]|uniref:Uncharacterized protein n=1 Tax=Lasiodiplodia mahajangana TaxID=1108764 RepID=A0ACC2JI62_9PEZI|nr:hypothetical protein O1611_g6476 [Lasiodiplodia mahajangana]
MAENQKTGPPVPPPPTVSTTCDPAILDSLKKSIGEVEDDPFSSRLLSDADLALGLKHQVALDILEIVANTEWLLMKMRAPSGNEPPTEPISPRLQEIQARLQAPLTGFQDWIQSEWGARALSRREFEQFVAKQETALLSRLRSGLKDFRELLAPIIGEFDEFNSGAIDLDQQTVLQQCIQLELLLINIQAFKPSLSYTASIYEMNKLNRDLSKRPSSSVICFGRFHLPATSAVSLTLSLLIAIMLGRLDMTVDECLGKFKKYATTLLCYTGLSWGDSGTLRMRKENEHKLVPAIKEVVNDFNPTAEKDKGRRKMFSFPNGRCKTGVLATVLPPNGSPSKPYMFRTFDCEKESGDENATYARTPLNPGPASPFSIEEVACATSTFFVPVNIEGRVFVDGGLTANNPAEQALKDVACLRRDNLGGVCLVSIGSGISHTHENSRKNMGISERDEQLIRVLRGYATQTEATHETIRGISSDNGIPYFRFNVDLDRELGSNGEVTLDVATKLTTRYVEQTSVQGLLRSCASAVISSKLRQHRCRNDMDGRPWVVPFSRNMDFVGRKEILRQLLPSINPKANTDDCQWTILEGLGGVGKSQIALEAAFRLRDQNQDCSVFWVQMTSALTVETSYRQIGRRLNVCGIDDKDADVKSLIKDALSSKEAGEWLLVLDGIDDAEPFFGGPGNPLLSEYIPFSPSGSILCTTRNHQVSVDLEVPCSSMVEVTGLTIKEGLDLFLKNLEAHDSDYRSLQDLLDLLDNHPLAIKQASAFMTRNRISVFEYIQLFRRAEEMSIRLLNKEFIDRSRYRSANHAVASIFVTTLDRISCSSPRAADYLNHLCSFGEGYIPITLLKLEGDDELTALEAIATLRSYGVLTKGDDSYSVHRLVRRIVQHRAKQEGNFDHYVTAATCQLANEFPPPDDENKTVWLRYLPHARALIGFRSYCKDVNAHNVLLSRMGRCMFLLGDYEHAETLYWIALRSQTLSNPEHLLTLAIARDLVDVLRIQGKSSEADVVYQFILRSQEEKLGPNHSSTLTSWMEPADALRLQGELPEVEEAYQSVLHPQEVLGPEHPVPTSLDGLASMLMPPKI